MGAVPPVCVLDPDGDVVRYVRRMKRAQRSRFWACYHTDMWEWEENGQRFGIVGCAVGASFAVLIAEQLFVSGCELLVSVASAGQIADLGPPPYLADEVLVGAHGRVHRGATWTTDAPFRETAETITKRRREGVLAVEMEAAALYAFGHARNKPVLCVAHVTNRLGCFEGDFEKSDHNGARSSLSLIRVIAERWRPSQRKALSGERTTS
jgi:hypothetical protein